MAHDVRENGEKRCRCRSTIGSASREQNEIVALVSREYYIDFSCLETSMTASV